PAVGRGLGVRGPSARARAAGGDRAPGPGGRPPAPGQRPAQDPAGHRIGRGDVPPRRRPHVPGLVVPPLAAAPARSPRVGGVAHRMTTFSTRGPLPGLLLTGIRVVLGIFWLLQLTWKPPPSFGCPDGGFCTWVGKEVQYPLIPLYGQLVRAVVQPNIYL